LDNSEKIWTITLEEDPETGELILPFPPDLLAESGWKEGDTLEWIDRGDGSWGLEKQKDKTDK
jgi:bifunctional DNA-binding transcriptional regulator/antitoxin component of YhaV-PrlF toxin-antitoxin module